MSNVSEEPGHGHSPAAWTAVIVMLIAFSIGTVAFFFDVQWLVWESAGLLVVGAILGKVLAVAGFGAYSPRYAGKGH
jgi:hypothetical protein